MKKGSRFFLDTEEAEWEEKTEEILTTKDSEHFVFDKNKQFLSFILKEDPLRNTLNPLNYTINPQLIDQESIPFRLEFSLKKQTDLYLKIRGNKNTKQHFQYFVMRVCFTKEISPFSIQSSIQGQWLQSAYHIVLSNEDLQGEHLLMRVQFQDEQARFKKVVCMSKMSCTYFPDLPLTLFYENTRNKL